MKRLKSMTAWADGELLISYNTPIAQILNNVLIIRDYPSMTTKKHLRTWLDEVANISAEDKEEILRILKDGRKFYKPMKNGNSLYIAYNLNISPENYIICETCVSRKDFVKFELYQKAERAGAIRV